MQDYVKRPLVLKKKSRSSRLINFATEANTFKDKLLRSAYIFLLLTLDLILFIYSINSRLIEGNFINLYFLTFLGVFFLISFVAIMVLSFSRDLQNLLCAVCSFMMTVLFFSQFGCENIEDSLSIYIREKASWLSILEGIHTSWPVGILFALIIFYAFRHTGALIFAVLVLFCSGLIGIQKNEFLIKNKNEYTEVKSLPSNGDYDGMGNIVYMMIPKLPSYQFLNNVTDHDFNEFRDLLIGFLAVNKFEIYPNAFVQSPDAASNIIDIINQVDYTSAMSANRGYFELDNTWNFIHGALDIVGLDDNRLYDYWRSNGVGISTYAMPGFNFCFRNGYLFTGRCVVKSYKTVPLVDEKASFKENLYTLLGEWLLSFNNDSLTKLARLIMDESGISGYKVISNNRRVSIEGSSAVLDRMGRDYMRDQGAQAYFSYVDMPSDIYIYDEFCHVKPREEWVSLEDNSVYLSNISEKRKAYVEQAKCLIGKIQEYLEEISLSLRFKETDIIIQGISPLQELGGLPDNEYKHFVNEKLVGLGIRRGRNPKFLVNANVCLASDFTKAALQYQDYCYTIDGMSGFSNEESLSLKQSLINNAFISRHKVVSAVKKYHQWYEQYKKESPSYREKLFVRQKEEEKRKLEEQKRIEESKKKFIFEKEQYNKNIYVPSEDVVSSENIKNENIGSSPSE